MDNMMDNISELLGGMSEDDMNSLREAAQSILGSSAGADKKSESEEKNDDASPISGIDPAMLMKLSSIMASMNKKDNRSELISALKPHLSPTKRKKADEAIQLLKLIDILPMIQNSFGSDKGG